MSMKLFNWKKSTNYLAYKMLYYSVCVCVFHAHASTSLLTRVQLFATLWTVSHQAPLCMKFSMQEYWSGLSFPTPENLPDAGTEPTSLVSPAWAGRFFTTAPTVLKTSASDRQTYIYIWGRSKMFDYHCLRTH